MLPFVETILPFEVAHRYDAPLSGLIGVSVEDVALHFKTAGVAIAGEASGASKNSYGPEKSCNADVKDAEDLVRNNPGERRYTGIKTRS